ncbi:hypothetical protein L1049_000029 [Liquidambar formosana]|uniref:F-box domain-containing protein n=1 Tax=Liquidambar formosana TaxID=63359 RepID=A0AAP0N6L3_LIQFO
MEELGFLNTDIPIDVLSRLPTKILLGLKCVSKGWNCLISDRSFIKVQLKKTEPVVGFFFQERFQWCNDDIKSYSYIPIGTEGTEVWHTIFDFLPEDVTVLASSNGLVCCRSCMPSPDPVIYVCNPSNKDWVSLKWDAHDKRNDLALAFDPFEDAIDISTNFKVDAHNKRISLALAFDPFQDPIDISTSFKVVRVRQMETDREDSYFSFEIYSSETGEWRKSKEICQYNRDLSKNNGIFIGGLLHWLTDGDQVLTFHVKNELSWLLSEPFPTTEFKSIPETCIGESEGRLHYVMISEDGLQVWVLEDYYESKWALKFSVTLEEMEEENPQLLYNICQRVGQRVAIDMTAWMDPLAFKDGLLFMRVSIKIYLYHIETRKMEELCTLSQLGTNSMFSPTVLPYTMSLVPLTRA